MGIWSVASVERRASGRRGLSAVWLMDEGVVVGQERLLALPRVTSRSLGMLQRDREDVLDHVYRLGACRFWNVGLPSC